MGARRFPGVLVAAPSEPHFTLARAPSTLRTATTGTTKSSTTTTYSSTMIHANMLRGGGGIGRGSIKSVTSSSHLILPGKASPTAGNSDTGSLRASQNNLNANPLALVAHTRR